MIDSRANLDVKITPPAPLPYVSRRALKRVRDALPAPRVCPYCNGCVELVNNQEVYRGREFGEWPYVYLCRPCDAYVGLHPDTDLPLGTLANKELRDARKEQKAYFEKLWRNGIMTRSEAYSWLAEQMSIKAERCHWALFSVEQCRLAGTLSQIRWSSEVQS